VTQNVEFDAFSITNAYDTISPGRLPGEGSPSDCPIFQETDDSPSPPPVVLRQRMKHPPLVRAPKGLRKISDPSPISLSPEIDTSSLTPVYFPGKLYNSPIPLDCSQSRVEQTGEKPSPATVLLPPPPIPNDVDRRMFAVMPALAMAPSQDDDKKSARSSRSVESVQEMIREWSRGISPPPHWSPDGEYENPICQSHPPTSSTDEIATPLDEEARIEDWSSGTSGPRVSSPSGSSGRSYPRTGLRPIQGNVSIASDDVVGVNVDSKAELCLPKALMDTLLERFDEISVPLNGICPSTANLQYGIGYDLLPNAALEKSTSYVGAPGQGITLCDLT